MAAPSDPLREAPLHIRQDLRLLFEAGDALELPHEILLAARATVLCGLPFRRIANRTWIKEARLGEGENLTVTFTALGDSSLPYGADRALLVWLQTRAYQGDGSVPASSFGEYFRAFGLSNSGGGYALLRARLDRLQSVTVRIERSGWAAPPAALEPAAQNAGYPLLAPSAGPEPLLIASPEGYALNASFREHLRANPVPLPLPLMRVFHNQPKAWDLAAFATYRCFVASCSSVVPWPGLRQMMGSSDANDYQLRRTLALALEEVKAVLPDLPVSFLPGLQGLAVAPWRPDAKAWLPTTEPRPTRRKRPRSRRIEASGKILRFPGPGDRRRIARRPR